jgi:hypothetical protein
MPLTPGTQLDPDAGRLADRYQRALNGQNAIHFSRLRHSHAVFCFLNATSQKK